LVPKRREGFTEVTNYDRADENQVAYEYARHASHVIGATEFLVESMIGKLCVRQGMEHNAADGGDANETTHYTVIMDPKMGKLCG